MRHTRRHLVLGPLALITLLAAWRLLVAALVEIDVRGLAGGSASAPANVDAVLSTAALAPLVPALAWLTVVVVATWLGQVPGALGRAARRWADALTPIACRRVVRAAVGVALAGSTVGLGLPATAATSPVDLPDVGRPAVSAPAATPGPTAAPTGETAGADAPTAAPVPAPSAEPTPDRLVGPTPTPPAAAPPASERRPATPTTSPTRQAAPAPLGRRAAPPQPATRPATRPAARPGTGARTQPPAPAAAIPPPSRAVHRPAEAADTVVVLRGDCLWDIAGRALGPGADDAQIAEAWPRWFAANRAVIGADPDLLLPGMVLRAPADR